MSQPVHGATWGILNYYPPVPCPLSSPSFSLRPPSPPPPITPPPLPCPLPPPPLPPSPSETNLATGRLCRALCWLATPRGLRRSISFNVNQTSCLILFLPSSICTFFYWFTSCVRSLIFMHVNSEVDPPERSSAFGVS